MSLRVLRVSGMPHGVQVWLEARNGKRVLFVDESLSTSERAQLVEAAFRAASNHKDPAAKSELKQGHTG